jgi:hypothetical protein
MPMKKVFPVFGANRLPALPNVYHYAIIVQNCKTGQGQASAGHCNLVHRGSRSGNRMNSYR